jgi:hypothetical protein
MGVFVQMTEDFRDMGGQVSDIDVLNERTRLLERSEVRRIGTSLLQARKNIARRLGITADTIENFRSLRNKIVPSWLMNKVHGELISALQLEAQNLEHELNLHRQTGAHHSDDSLMAAEAQLAAVRKILMGENK